MFLKGNCFQQRFWISDALLSLATNGFSIVDV